MIKIIEEKTHDNLIALEVKGKVDKKDYDSILPIMDQMVETHQKLNAYAEVHELDGITAKALCEEVKADVKYFNNFEKIAVVGDAKWKEKVTKAADLLPGVESRYFDFTEKEKAQNWIEAQT